MREIEGQRGLRIGVTIAFDAGRGAAERAPPVSADDKARGNAAAAFESDGRASVVRLDRAGIVLDPRERGQRLCARIEGGEQMPVFDVVAECPESDLGRGKAD